MIHRIRDHVARLLLLAFSVAACGGSAARQEPSSGHGQASDDAGTCSPTSITFSLQLPSSPTGELSCLGVSQTLPPGWASSWLSITGPDGESLVLDAPCNVVCGGQLANECYVADCEDEPLAPTSSNPTRSWDGTTYSEGRESASCALPGPFICYDPGCAPPGDYVAQMCATPLSTTDASPETCGTAPIGQATPVCTLVPFHWPPAVPGTIVLGSLATPDAG